MFVVMLPEGDESSRAKYDFFRKCEPQLREVYNTRSAEDATNVDADDEVEESGQPARRKKKSRRRFTPVNQVSFGCRAST